MRQEIGVSVHFQRAESGLFEFNLSEGKLLLTDPDTFDFQTRPLRSLWFISVCPKSNKQTKTNKQKFRAALHVTEVPKKGGGGGGGKR